MNTASPYYDRRSEFFRQFFERGLPYDQYLLTGSDRHQARWREFESKVALSTSQQNLLSSFIRKIHILCMSGIWCGDCARQGPLLQAIASTNANFELRFVDNRQESQLQDELRINGAEKVPVVVLLSEDFFEIGRFGDRHLSVYRHKIATEVGPACDSGIGASNQVALAVELQEWVDYIEWAHHMLRLSPMLRARYND